MTWIWSLSAASGLIVGASSKFFPSPLGHHESRFTPLGIVINAIRRGTPAAAVLGATSAACDKRGQSDGNVGKATHAPTPRRNLRRLIDQYRSAARSRSLG